MGRTQFGKHELIAELGHGGMADVFLAVQAGPAGSGFRKLTVIKRLRSDLLDDPEFVTMLVDEARIAARLNHPNVVQTTDAGAIEDRHFIAMEYLEGQPLHRIQVRAAKAVKAGERPPLSREQYYLILMDVLAGLHHAHELLDFDGSPLEVVHRDVTPQNIFVTYDGQVKVVDFGIAKATNRAAETRQGIVKGKIRYMAPEQAIGLSVTRRADLFAVGILLWEAATGRRMWADKDDLEIVKNLISNELPPMPKEIDPTVPDAIDKIARKALATRTEERYATAEEFRIDLEEYLASVDMLVEPRRSLGPAVAELFKDKREQMRALIEKQISKIEEPSSVDPPHLRVDSSSGGTQLLQPPPFSVPPRAPRSSGDYASGPKSSGDYGAGSPEALLAITGLPSSMGVPSLPTTTLPVAAGPAAPPHSKTGRIALGAVAVLALVAAALLVVKWRTSPAAQPEQETAATAKPPPASVVIRVSATPPEAKIRIDDGAPEPVPFERAFPSDQNVHRMTLEADGYAPRVEQIMFTQDVRMALDLVATRPASSSKVASHPGAAPIVRPSTPQKTTAIASPKHTPTPAPAPAPAPARSPDPAPAPTKKDPFRVDKGDPWSN